MTRPASALLIALDPPAADPAWACVPPRASDTLPGGYAVALLAAAGVPARQLSGPGAAGLGPIAREVARSGASVVALAAGPDPSPAVRLLTRLLLDAPDPPVVAWTGVPSAARPRLAADAPEGVPLLRPAFERALLGLTLGGPGDPGDAAAPHGLPSPWTSGALRVALAPELGVEHGRIGEDGVLRRHEPGRLRDELRWIDARTVGPAVVPIAGPPLQGDGGDVLDVLAGAGLRRVRAALSVPASAPADLLRRAAELGVARLDVVLGCPAGDEALEAVARLAGGAGDVHVRLEAPEGTDVDAVEADVARIAATAAAVELRWTGPSDGAVAPPSDLAIPELRPHGAVAAALAAEREVSGRLLHAFRGAGVPGRGPRRGAHTVVWSGGADPADHAAWLARTLDRDGLLVRLDGGGDPVGGVPTAVVRPRGDDGLHLPAGDRLVLRGWADPRPAPEDAQLLLTLRGAEDREALGRDVAAALAGCTLPAVAAGPRWTVEGEAAVLGLDVPPARLERLWVHDGAVRTGAGGPVVGAPGDDLEALRAAALHAAPEPGPLDDPRTAWVLRALVAVRALRGRGVEGPLRVAGLGGGLLPGVEGGHRPTSGVLIARDDLLHLVDPATGRVSRLTADTALIWELLATSTDPGQAVAGLARARSLPEDRATAAVRQVLGGLGPTLLPVPAPGAPA